MRTWENEQHWSESTVSTLTAGGDRCSRPGSTWSSFRARRWSSARNGIDAGRDIRLAALRDMSSSTSESMGLTFYPAALTVEGSYATSEGTSTTCTNARVEAGGTVELDAGRDVALAGGVVSGVTVNVAAGRNLSVISLQDTSTYEEESIQRLADAGPGVAIGGSFSYGRPAATTPTSTSRAASSPAAAAITSMSRAMSISSRADRFRRRCRQKFADRHLAHLHRSCQLLGGLDHQLRRVADGGWLANAPGQPAGARRRQRHGALDGVAGAMDADRPEAGFVRYATARDRTSAA